MDLLYIVIEIKNNNIIFVESFEDKDEAEIFKEQYENAFGLGDSNIILKTSTLIKRKEKILC